MAGMTTAVIAGVTALTSMTMGIVDSSKAAQEKKAAERAAKKSIEEAKKETEIMPKQALSLNLDLYKAQQEASNVAAATGIEAAQQGEARGLAAAVGRTHMANVNQQRDIRLDKGQKLDALEMIKAEERAAASDARANLHLAEAEGAQAAAADAVARQQAATTQAVTGGVNAVAGAASAYSAVQGPYDPTSAGMAAKSALEKGGEASVYAMLDSGPYSGYEGLTGKALENYLIQNVSIDDMNRMEVLNIR